MYNVAIVGGGPAGIFTALELVKLKPDWKILLIEKGISKPQFRELAGLSPATLTKLNKGEYVSMEVLTKICKALKCDIGDIVNVIQ